MIIMLITITIVFLIGWDRAHERDREEVNQKTPGSKSLHVESSRRFNKPEPMNQYIFIAYYLFNQAIDNISYLSQMIS